MKPDQFRILRAAAAAKASGFELALADVAAGIEAGAIRNSVLNDAKFTLSRTVDAAWKQHVSEPFFYAGGWKDQPQDVQDLNDSITIMGLHDVISASKKVSKSKATGPAVDAMRAFVAEVLPLSLAVASLKDKIVKGRAPSTGPGKPENPNKVVKTCPVCFRQIALVRGKMAHHGYERPGHGWQTASCPGIRFKPLEVSSDGLAWLVSTLQSRLETVQSAYKNRNSLDSLLVQVSRDKHEMITKESPLWQQNFRRHVAELESEIQSLTRQVPRLEEMLRNWKPEKAASAEEKAN